jgi:Na+/melibiose symporter-like transporter
VPDAPAGAPVDRGPGDLPARSADGTPRDRDRSPGWREVLLIAGVILVAVFALEVASAVLPPVREAFGGFPVTIAVLVAGTLGLLLFGIVRRPRR